MVHVHQVQVLIVDDSHVDRLVARALVENMCQECGCMATVVSMPGANEALDWLQSEKPENLLFILSDYDMPGMLGTDFCRRILESGDAELREVPFVIFSSRFPGRDIPGYVMRQLAGWLPKPLRIEALKSILLGRFMKSDLFRSKPPRIHPPTTPPSGWFMGSP